jgi:hypothetical protein
MKLQSIEIPYSWDDIDEEDDEIDVFVKTDTGCTYNLAVGTAKSIESLMVQEKQNFLVQDYPVIIVKKLTKETIEETIKAYVEEEDGYWIRFYHFVLSIDLTVFKQLEMESLQKTKEFPDKSMKVKSIEIPYSWADIDNENDKINVLVETDTGFYYNLTVVTPKKIESLMDEKKMNYLEIGSPFIVVRELTKEIIEETMKAYVEEQDGYSVRLYHFSKDINSTVFKSLETKQIQFQNEFKKFLSEENKRDE